MTEGDRSARAVEPPQAKACGFGSGACRLSMSVLLVLLVVPVRTVMGGALVPAKRDGQR